MTMSIKLAVLALLVVSCSATRSLKQDDGAEAAPPGAALARLAWVHGLFGTHGGYSGYVPMFPGPQAASLPSCRLDPKFFTIDLDKCDSLSSLADRVAKHQPIEKVTCEPECAAEWKKLNGACAKDIFNTFSADATGFMNYTLLYWGACSAQTIATEMGYPPAPTSVLTAEKAEQWNALIYGSAPAPAPTPELGVDPTDAAAAQAAVAAAASATAATAAAGLHAVKAAEGP